MKDLLTTDFDDALKSHIPHLSNYPEMLPFVGKQWSDTNKILFVGESHYLPYHEIRAYNTSFDFYENWYQGKSADLDDNHRNYISTRLNVIKVENREEYGYFKPLTIYYNLKSALREMEHYQNSEFVFDKFAYYNYFQKPASILEQANENRSIKPSKNDVEIAFDTLTKVVSILGVKTILFISKKSYDYFKASNAQNPNSFNDVTIDFLPHAGRPWWNKTSLKYAIDGDNIALTGKQKFIELIKRASV